MVTTCIISWNTVSLFLCCCQIAACFAVPFRIHSSFRETSNLYFKTRQLNSLGRWDFRSKEKQLFQKKNRKMLASYNGCLFQSPAPERERDHCPAFVLNLAGQRLAMLTLATWLCASASRVACCWTSEGSNH